jgi:hypothetical protein
VEYYPLIPAGAAETARIPVPAIAPGTGPESAPLLIANVDHVKSYAPHFRHGRFKIIM